MSCSATVNICTSQLLPAFCERRRRATTSVEGCNHPGRARERRVFEKTRNGGEPGSNGASISLVRVGPGRSMRRPCQSASNRVGSTYPAIATTTTRARPRRRQSPPGCSSICVPAPLAADVESSPHDRRPLAHPGRPKWPATCCRAIVSASIPFPSSRIVRRSCRALVVDRDRDALRLRVLDRIAQRLAGDPERFLADDGIEVARVAVDRDVNRRHGTGRPLAGQLQADRGDAVRQIVHRRCRRAQARAPRCAPR